MLKKYGQIITFDLTKSFLSTGNVNRQVGNIEQKEVLKLSAISVDSELGGGRKGGPKTAKPHRNTPKNRKPHRIFSRIPKPRVHVGHNMKADVSKTCDIF